MNAESGTSGSESIDVRVHRGVPTEEELAAVIAVVSEAYATEERTAVAGEPAVRSAWDVSARALRGPLPRGIGWARSFQ